jgi:hypothetical protein
MKLGHPFQLPRIEEILAGGKFWGYLDTSALQMRYVIAAHFVKDCGNIVEVGGYRRNAITNFLTGDHKSVTVFSLDAEFEESERDTLNSTPCTVKHIRDYFQNYSLPASDLGLVALGLEIHGTLSPIYELLQRAKTAVIEVPIDHQPSVECLKQILSNAGARVRCHVSLDFSENEPILRDELMQTNLNIPFWRRSLYVLEPKMLQK